ncbi:MAG: MBL fold metallo-hydrolase [Caldilineaceae bacterium]
MSTQPTLLWVNHASFVLSYGAVRLMSDPWLFGSAFNNGWDLLCETQFTMEDFHTITHLWFSHEHPDHFAPPVLQQIPEAARRGITVIFQETKDQKVIRYCRSLGFQVQELPNHGWHGLRDNVRVMCGKVPYFDSWLLIETENCKILNANDCVVDGDGVAQEIARHTGTVDLLLTQFSYANWIGNPEDVEERRASAREKLRRVKLQIETFQPTQTIPFASFVYFCHAENAYLNDAMNTIRDATTFIAEKTASQPIVLYPGETWEVGQPHDNERSLQRYDADYDLGAKPLRQAEPMDFTELQQLSRQYIARMKGKNSALFMYLMSLPPLRYFQPFTLYLRDLNQMVRFDFTHGIQHSTAEPATAEVTLAAESLAYVFKHDWGYDTLEVNGRFQATPTGHQKLVKNFFLGPLNNTGRYLHPRTLFEPSFMRRALAKLRSLG